MKQLIAQTTLITLAMMMGAACGATAVEDSPTPTVALRTLPTQTATAAVPTVALPTASLQPIPTFQPTATPFVYSVQSGDTLIGIAVRHNVSLEAIEGANLGIDPGNLQPGQAIIIPPPDADDGPSVVTVATALPVAVPPFTCQPTPVGSLICYSEFVNLTDQAVANLAVDVYLLNADNTPDDHALAFAPLDVVPVGVAVPLAVVFADGNSRTAVGSVLQADGGAELLSNYVTLAVRDVSASETPAGFALSGALINEGNVEAHSIVVVGTLYAPGGWVTGYRRIVLGEGIAAGGALPFSVAFPGIASAASWAVVAQGRIR